MSADTPRTGETRVAEIDTRVTIDDEPVRVRTETNGDEALAVVEAPGIDIVASLDAEEFGHLRDQGRASAVAHKLVATLLNGGERR